MVEYVFRKSSETVSLLFGVGRVERPTPSCLVRRIEDGLVDVGQVFLLYHVVPEVPVQCPGDCPAYGRHYGRSRDDNEGRDEELGVWVVERLAEGAIQSPRAVRLAVVKPGAGCPGDRLGLRPIDSDQHENYTDCNDALQSTHLQHSVIVPVRLLPIRADGHITPPFLEPCFACGRTPLVVKERFFQGPKKPIHLNPGVPSNGRPEEEVTLGVWLLLCKLTSTGQIHARQGPTLRLPSSPIEQGVIKHALSRIAQRTSDRFHALFLSGEKVLSRANSDERSFVALHDGRNESIIFNSRFGLRVRFNPLKGCPGLTRSRSRKRCVQRHPDPVDVRDLSSGRRSPYVLGRLSPFLVVPK